MAHEYTWMGALGVVGAACAAFGLGANDVSNSFSTTIGSKTLPMGKSLLLAAPAEFLGAVLLGRRVTQTISSDFLDLSCFTDDHDILAYGMLIVLWVSAIWMIICTKYGMPVSSTQAVIGALVGVGLTFGGKDCIHWEGQVFVSARDFTENIVGVLVTTICWIVSPILAGLLSGSLFWLLRRFVLHTNHSLSRSVYAISGALFLAGFADSHFITLQVEETRTVGNIPLARHWGFSILGGAIVLVAALFYFSRLRTPPQGIISSHCSIPSDLVRRRIERVDDNVGEDENKRPSRTCKHEPKPSIAVKQIHRKMRNFSTVKYLAKELAKDMHKEAFKASELVRGIHDNAEVFDHKTEDMFKPAQVIAAVLFAFAHGAHTASNVVGPLTTLFACGICLGLLLFGYNIISALGLKMAKITPTRGAVITFSAYAVLTFFNRVATPVGSTFGVAVLEGQKGVNWEVFMKVLVGFLFTTLCCCGLSALMFAQGIYSPSAYQPFT